MTLSAATLLSMEASTGVVAFYRLYLLSPWRFASKERTDIYKKRRM
jgi:hypothetical protein